GGEKGSRAQEAASKPRRAPIGSRLVRSRDHRRPRCRVARRRARSAQASHDLADTLRGAARPTDARDAREDRDDGIRVEEAAPTAGPRGSLNAAPPLVAAAGILLMA